MKFFGRKNGKSAPGGPDSAGRRKADKALSGRRSCRNRAPATRLRRLAPAYEGSGARGKPSGDARTQPRGQRRGGCRPARRNVHLRLGAAFEILAGAGRHRGRSCSKSAASARSAGTIGSSSTTSSGAATKSLPSGRGRGRRKAPSTDAKPLARSGELRRC